MCQFLARLNFLEEAPRQNERKSDVITKWGLEQGARDRRAAGDVYYSRGDGVKRDVIVNIFAASAAVAQDDGPRPIVSLQANFGSRLEPSNLALRPLEFRLAHIVTAHTIVYVIAH